MELEILDGRFCICKVREMTQIDFSAPYCFVSRTPREISLVCASSHAPSHPLEKDDGWRAFRMAGILDFSLTGIIASLSRILSGHGIPLFVVSTFDTDYVLVREASFDAAIAALADGGFPVSRNKEQR
jgi:hypothetical protein